MFPDPEGLCAASRAVRRRFALHAEHGGLSTNALKELNPAILITCDVSVRDFVTWLYGLRCRFQRAAALKVADSLRGAHESRRVMNVSFTDPAGVSDPVKLMRQLYPHWSSSRCRSSGDRAFTTSLSTGTYDLWACENVRRYPDGAFGALSVIRLSPMPNRCCAILSKRLEVVEGNDSRGVTSFRPRCFCYSGWWLCWASKVLRPGWSRRVDDVASGVERREGFPIRQRPVRLFRNAKTGDVRVRVLPTSATRACPSPEVRTIRWK